MSCIQSRKAKLQIKELASHIAKYSSILETRFCSRQLEAEWHYSRYGLFNQQTLAVVTAETL